MSSNNQIHADGMYLIAEGQISIEISSPGEVKKCIATLGPGDIFGEVGVFTNKPRSANALTKSKCHIYFIPRNALDSIINSNSPSAFLFIQRIISLIATRIKEFFNKNKVSPLRKIAEKPESELRVEYAHLPAEVKNKTAELKIFNNLEKNLLAEYKKNFAYFKFAKGQGIPLSIQNEFLLLIVKGEILHCAEFYGMRMVVNEVVSDEIINPTQVADINLDNLSTISTCNTYALGISTEFLDIYEHSELVIAIYNALKYQLTTFQVKTNHLVSSSKNISSLWK